MAKKHIGVAWSDSDNFKTLNATKNKRIKNSKNSHIWFNVESLYEIQINTIYENPREELLYDIDPEGENIKIFKCPEINIKLENINVRALLDSGSEITCISQEFYEKFKGVFEKKPTLPIVGKVIKNATGERSVKLKIQVLLTVQLGESEIQLIFIVVPKLIKDCIFGYDAQKAINMVLDTVSEQIHFTIENKKYELPYMDTLVRPTEYSTLKRKLDEADFSANSELEVFSCEENVDSTVYGPEYEITYEDIQKKNRGLLWNKCEATEKINADYL